jgi:hypothetical protein
MNRAYGHRTAGIFQAPDGLPVAVIAFRGFRLRHGNLLIYSLDEIVVPFRVAGSSEKGRAIPVDLTRFYWYPQNRVPLNMFGYFGIAAKNQFSDIR